jgi:hypothetical protein
MVRDPLLACRFSPQASSPKGDIILKTLESESSEEEQTYAD